MACNKQKYVGRDVVLEYYIGCGDVFPDETDWKRLGSMRTKEFSLEWETTDATADDSIGSLRENLATFQSLSISGDGTLKASGGGSESLIELTKHIANPVATAGQPLIWLRMTFPDLTFTSLMLLTNMSRSAPYDDVATYSLESSATTSDFGLVVEDTPDADAPDPTSIEVVPATLSLTAGEDFDLNGVVLPVGAPQGLRFTSGNTAAATVNLLTGKVTAVAAGSATITAASVADPAVTDTTAVTVLPVVTGISVSPTAVTIEEGDTQALTAAVQPSGAFAELTYTSANPSTATVNGSGLITGVAAGSTTVTVTSVKRPSVKVVVPVTVTPA